MSNENTSIHDFDIALICEYFNHLERQGPGSPAATRQALAYIEGLTEQSQIVDLGCGTGGQTITLAKHAPGQITGLDLFPAFIDSFRVNIQRHHLASRVKGAIGSMEELPFLPQSLDLIWSEGAIYNMGFERGITEWHKFLKPGGYIAVTEVAWFTRQRPSAIEAFWLDAYPEIDTIATKIAQMENAGYVPVATFILPENCWTEHFYKPQETVQELFLEKYKGNKTAEAFIANERREAKLYEQYKDYYGYVFFIGKKI